MNTAPSPRTATPADAPLLADIHAAGFARGWSAREFAAYAADPSFLCLIAQSEHGAGFILCRAVAAEAEILTLAVHPDSRRRGIARQLCSEAMTRLNDRGVNELHLEVGAGNAPALSLYESLGFARTGTRPGYYGSRDSAPGDAVTMRLRIA